MILGPYTFHFNSLTAYNCNIVSVTFRTISKLVAASQEVRLCFRGEVTRVVRTVYVAQENWYVFTGCSDTEIKKPDVII